MDVRSAALIGAGLGGIGAAAAVDASVVLSPQEPDGSIGGAGGTALGALLDPDEEWQPRTSLLLGVPAGAGVGLLGAVAGAPRLARAGAGVAGLSGGLFAGTLAGIAGLYVIAALRGERSD